MMDRWDRIDETLARIEQYLVSVFLSSMIILAFLQIALRNLLATGFSWGDATVRYLVLWVGFIGAAMATREGKHITIDVVAKWIHGTGNTAARLIANLFSSGICCLLTAAAVKFIRNEAQLGGAALFGIPPWVLQSIIPITFFSMAARFGLHSLRALFDLLTRKES
jgi:TRAP-type C4-dicarboxylate transport system permease small subunit